MSNFIKKLEVLNQNKEQINRAIREIPTVGVSKTQAQNLREYSVQTQSIDDILLYIDYQMVRDRKLQDAGKKLMGLIEKYREKIKDNEILIDMIRYMLGTFARWVMIESKKGE